MPPGSAKFHFLKGVLGGFFTGLVQPCIASTLLRSAQSVKAMPGSIGDVVSRSPVTPSEDTKRAEKEKHPKGDEPGRKGTPCQQKAAGVKSAHRKSRQCKD